MPFACVRCDTEYATQEGNFNRSAKKVTGYIAICRPCTRASVKASTAKKADEYTAKQQAWAKRNPVKVRETQQRYRAKQERGVATEIKRRWRVANAKLYTDTILLRNYGITSKDVAAMEEAQHGVCAICEQPETRLTTSGTQRALCIDHNHKTGRVRGLLCASCNMGVGQLRDSPTVLRAAAAYIERFQF